MTDKLKLDSVEVTKADIFIAFLLWFLPLCLGAIIFYKSKNFDLIIDLMFSDNYLFAVVVFLFMALTNLGRFVEICHLWKARRAR